MFAFNNLQMSVDYNYQGCLYVFLATKCYTLS